MSLHHTKQVLRKNQFNFSRIYYHSKFQHFQCHSNDLTKFYQYSHKVNAITHDQHYHISLFKHVNERTSLDIHKKQIGHTCNFINQKCYQKNKYHTQLNRIQFMKNAANMTNSEEHQEEFKLTEQNLENLLLQHFDDGTNQNNEDDTLLVKVNDISGGCGSMFDILVVSKAFEGLSVVKQHKMVVKILQKHISNMHGLTINTKTPQQAKKIGLLP